MQEEIRMASGPYLTAKRFAATGGFGIDTSSLTTAQLRGTLQRATTTVNQWCNAAQVPQPFDFRGGAVTDEQHLFPIPSPLIPNPGSRRVFVYQRPLRTVTAFAIQFTTTYQITLDAASDIFINATEGWCEIIASQPTIIGYPPIGYWYGLYQPIAKVSYTYGHQIAVTDDGCEGSSPTTFWASYGQWDATAAIEVQVNGVVVDSADYSTNAADGSITFVTAPAVGAEVTASYTTTLPDAISQATGLIAVDQIARSRIAARGMIGLSNIKVAEISMTMAQAGQGRYVTRNGVSIPESAAALLGAFALGSVG